MRGKVVVTLILVCLAAGAAWGALPPVRVTGFYPVYLILGAAQASDDKASVEDRVVVIYDPDDKGEIKTVYGYGYIKGGKFDINPLKYSILEVGKSYKVAIPRGEDGYGAAPLDLTISGIGYDTLSAMLTLAYGAGPGGVTPPAVSNEPAPGIKLWFGSRVYQKELVARGEKFVISDKPEVKADIAIDNPYSLAEGIESYAIVVDNGTAAAREVALTAANVASKVMASGTSKISSLSLKYVFEEPLSEGAHTFAVTARSSGALGTAAAATELASVEVLGGALRLVGLPLCFPNPFNISRDKEVIVQYTLSANANIEIIITSAGGRRVMRTLYAAGSEGGTAGLNKVKWDGRTDQGYFAGNAIYMVAILARDEGRMLGTVKMTISE